MKHNNSKHVITILILIIILLLIGIVSLVWRQSRMPYEYAKDNQARSVHMNANPFDAEIPAENIAPEKKYSSEYGSFMYNPVASVIPNNSKGVINIGTGENDPNIESIVFISDVDKTTPFYDNSHYVHETIGENDFESFEDTERGDKQFVLVKGKKAISVTVKIGGPRYVDLGSISF